MNDDDVGVERTATAPPVSVMRRDLVVVLLTAVLLRVVYFAQYAVALPFLYGPIADSVVYLEQSFRVRHGEFGAAVLLAFSPLYGYFLALVGRGASLVTPVLVQLVFGCVAAVVIYVVSFRLAGRVSARFSTALYLGYGTLLYYESKILSESLSILLAVIALGVYLGDGVRAGKLRPAIVSGALFGFATLARASLVFAAPLTVVVAALPWRSPSERGGVLKIRAVGVALGFALVLGGNGVLTFIQTGLFVPVILVSRTVEASGGSAFDGRLSSIQFGEGLASSYDVVTSAKRRIERSRAGVREQPSSATKLDLAGFLRHAPDKLLRTLSPREITFQYGFNGERDYVGILQALPVSFGLLLLWGAFGAIALVRERGARALLPFAPLVLGVLVTTTLYHPSSRYRFALILPMLLLAGVGLTAVWGGGSVRRKWVGRVLLLASLLLVGLHYRSRQYNAAEFAIQLAMSAGIAGDRPAELAHARRAAAFAPHDVSVQQRAKLLIEDAQAQPSR